MRKTISFLFYICLIGMALSSCNSQNAPTPDLALTATSDQATQTFLCCTATPDLSAITPVISPFPPPNFGPNVILYRGNTQRTGVYDVPAIRHQPEVKWQTKVNSTLPTSPLVVEDILYTGSSNGKLYALNIETGEEIWSVGGFGQLENAGAVSGDMIVSGGYSQDVRALDRRTGSELWSFTTENLIQATPLIVGNRVYIATYHAVYALDLNSGSLIWEVETGDEDAYTGAPAYDAGVIYTTGGKLLLALDAESGRELWRTEKDEQFLGLAVANGFVYVGNWNKDFYAFDQVTGEERWKFQAEGEIWFPPAVNEDTVYVGNVDTLHALNAQTGELRWSLKTGGNFVSEPIIAEDVVYMSDGNHETKRGTHHLYALDAITGEELWVFETVSTFLPAPALGNGVIYLTSTGEVIAFK